MSNIETIPNELLTPASGGAQTWRELSQFANQHGFTVTSSCTLPRRFIVFAIPGYSG